MAGTLAESRRRRLFAIAFPLLIAALFVFEPFGASANDSLENRPADAATPSRDPYAAPTVRSVAQRREAHASAANALDELTFFADARGLFATPRLSEVFYFGQTAGGWRSKILEGVAERYMGMYAEGYSPRGFLDRTQDGVRLVVTGCATCHYGRALGHDIPGLGNKNADPFALGYWIEKGEKVLSVSRNSPSDESQVLRNRALNTAALLQTPNLANKTQGMVPTALIAQWLFKAADMPLPAGITPGAVKVPALWGYREKAAAGMFCDGMGDAHGSAWPAAVELSVGGSIESVRANFDEVLAAEEMLCDLLPPRYPLSIDKDRAAAGRKVFNANCRRCHGDYERDADGLPIVQPPKRVALPLVGTDSDRLDIITPQLRKAMAGAPMADLIRLHPDYIRGYFAPRLEGIWARFPYLHNASVPNFMALLTRPEDRPDVFDLVGAGEAHRFDEALLGLDVPAPATPAHKLLTKRAAQGARDVYDTSRLGQSNKGHPFGVKLSAGDKRALTEYLKTL